jgi:GntR family transcriptional regulator
MEFQEQQAIYQQIASHVCEEILRGAWGPGARVPSVRELAAQIAVNPNTVIRSYTHLEDLGVLYQKRGLGYFVHDEARHRIVEVQRRHFLAKDLPQLFRQMDLLKISLDEVKANHDLYRAHNPISS